MNLRRYLDPFEELSIAGPPVAFPVEYQGRLDCEALAQAFTLLSSWHPVLSGWIRRNSRGYLLAVPRHRYPKLVVREGDEQTLRGEVLRPLDSSEAVSEVLLVRGAEHGYVTLRVSHSVADGGAYLALLDQLWGLYTDVVHGGHVEPEGNISLPRPPFELLQQRGADITHYDPGELKRELGSLAVSDTSYRRVILSQEDTARIVSAAREHKISVHELTAGAMVEAGRRHQALNVPGTATVRTDVNLRSRVSPPVQALDTTNFSAPQLSAVPLGDAAGSVGIARQVGGRLRAALRDPIGALSRREIILPGISETSPSDLLSAVANADCAMNNLGKVPEWRTPGSLALVDLLELPLNGVESTSSGFHRIWTYGGRLHLFSHYPQNRFTTDDVSAIIGEFVGELCSITRFDLQVEVTS